MQAHFQGDTNAFPSLLEYYRRDLWGFLRHRLQSQHDAEDLFQDICLIVYDKLASLKEPGAFRSWLFAIASNRVRNFFRSKKTLISLEQDREEESGPSIVLTDDERRADVTVEIQDHLHRLRHHLSALKERDREILLLHVMADVPQQQIADMFELNLNTVKTIIRRSKIELARLLAEDEHE